ncbi:MAG: ZIP family metal transporter [Clostridia bacterium]|nr:ZIP family metal transporter [Clostridia bacterium]
MILCNNFVNKKLKIKNNSNFSSSLLKTGIIIGIGLTIHNLPEGLAIGSGFEASSALGLSLAIAICIHDFPEGISMAIPLKQGGFSKLRVIIYTTISGISTGVGALIGALIGGISPVLIGFSLSFAARCNALYCIM